LQAEISYKSNNLRFDLIRNIVAIIAGTLLGVLKIEGLIGFIYALLIMAGLLAVHRLSSEKKEHILKYIIVHSLTYFFITIVFWILFYNLAV